MEDFEKVDPAAAGEANTPKVTEPGNVLRPHIVASGFPNRNRLILDYEEKLFPQWAEEIIHTQADLTSNEAASNFSLRLPDLQTAFANEEPVPLIAAAFVAGRCKSDTPAENEQIKQMLRTLVDKVQPKDYSFMGQPVIEAVFSLALLGEKEFASEQLHSLLKVKFPTFEAYLAAYYLAQMGDLAGYPVMHKALEAAMDHTRLMAVRYLFGFKPYDGKKFRNLTVDLKSDYLKRLKDPSNYVSREVPFLMIQAGIPRVKEILTDNLPHIIDEETREAAEDALDKLEI